MQILQYVSLRFRLSHLLTLYNQLCTCSCDNFSDFVTSLTLVDASSDFIWDFGKLPFPTHLGKYFIKIGKIRAKIHEIGKIKAIFGLGMTPIYGLKNGLIKSLASDG